MNKNRDRCYNFNSTVTACFQFQRMNIYKFLSEKFGFKQNSSKSQDKMLRGEPSSPVKSFTFVVDGKVKETPNKYSTVEFKHSQLSGNRDVSGKVLRSSVGCDAPSIVSVGGHSFVQSAILAYNKHMHLVVRPDDVWIAVITQLSFYVAANPEELRSKFVSFDGKKELVIDSDGTLHTAPYDQLALMMADKIAANIKDPSLRNWVLPDFSTTSNTDRVVGAFALMATLKEYFNYKLRFMCGLPKVTILGSVEDWRLIRQRAERLIEFDNEHNYMRKWIDMLLPVIDHFVHTAEEKPDTKWWNRITNHVGGGSGPSYVSGWITVFMVFSSEGKWMGDQKEVPFGGLTDWTWVDTGDIPKGYVSCPLKLDDNGTVYDAEIYAGHIVSKLINNKTTIVPLLDWCILLKDEGKTEDF